MASGGGVGGQGQAAEVYVDLVARFDDFERRLAEAEAGASDAGERAGSGFGSKFSAGVGIAAGGLVALTGAVTALVGSTVGLAQESAQNVNEFQSKLGETREEAERLGTVAEQVFANNFGDNLGAAGEAVGIVRQQLGDLADDELQRVTEGALAIQKTFGVEVADSVSATKTLMEQFGLTSQQATDFLAKGFQEGLDRSGDFLDTVNEYSTQFANGGASAEQFFNLIKNGAQGGALGTDRAADAFKEFRVRIQDGSKGVAEALESIGINSEDLAKKMASGQVTAAEAFQMVQGKLAGLKDENLRMQAGVALIGTQYEDLGQKGAAALSMTGKSMKDMEGATASLSAKYNSFGALAEGMWRKVQVALLPVGKELLGMANEAVPYLTKAFDQVGQKLPGMIKSGIDTAKQFGTAAVNVYNSVKPAIETTIVTVQKLSGFIERNKEVLIPLTAAVGAGAAAFGLYRAGVVAVTAAKAAWTVATTTATTASVALRAAIAFLTGPIGLAITAIGLLVGAGVALYRNWDEVVAWARKTWSQIKGIVTDAIEGAMSYLRSVDMKGVGLDIVQGLVNGILAGPRLVLAAARTLGSKVVEGVKGVLNIQSPSRVMKELGEFTSEGFVVGIESGRPNVKKAAEATAKAFLDAFSDLKLERQVGDIDLSTYTRTLEQAAAQLRGKLKTVQEGTPAYAQWLKALQAVTSELDSVKSKSSGAQASAKGLADEMTRNRQQIEQGEAMERYVANLRSATAAQLASALETAKARGETEKYNAIREEQRRRTEVATAAQEKATEATRRHQQQVADNRAQIAANEAQERYVLGLRSATDAQLRSALETARSRGEVEKYNAIRDEQKRRADAVRAAEDKATEATRRQQQQLADNRAQIIAGEAQERYVRGLRSATDAQLSNALATARARGEVEKYNAIRDEQKRRSDAAAAAHDKAAEAARREADAVAQGRKAIAEGREYEAWKEGLKGLTEEQLRASAASLEAAGNQQRYNDVMGELDRRADDASKKVEAWSDNLDRLSESNWVKSLRDMTNAQLATALSTYEAEQNVSRYNAVLSEQARRTDEAAKKHESWTDNLDKLEDGKWVSSLRDMSAAQLDSALATAKAEENVSRYNAVLAEQARRADDAEKAQRSWLDNLDKIQQATWVKSLRDMTTEQLAAALASAELSQNVGEYNAVLAEQGRRTDEVTKKTDAWNDNLVKLSEGNWSKGLKDFSEEQLLSALATAEAEQNVGRYNAVLTEMLRRVDDAGKKQEAWFDNLDKITEGNWVKGLRDLDESQLQAALSAAVAEQNVARYNAVLAELARRTDEASKSQDTWNDNVNKLNFSRWTAGLKNMSDAELDVMLGMAAAAGNLADYNAILAEQGRRVDDASKKHQAWLDNLEKIERGTWVDSLRNLTEEELQAALASATAAENLDQFNAVLAEMKRRTDDAAKAQASWNSVIEKLDRDQYAESLKGMSDAQLVLMLETASSTQNAEDFTAILAEQSRRTTEAAKNTEILAAARQKLTEIQAGGARPFASELAALEALRGKPGVVAAELDKLIASYTQLQAQTEKQQGLEKKINQWSNYAKQLIPVVTGAMEALGGTSEKVAGEWAADLGSMVNDLTNFGMAIAKGDYFGAAVQALTTIFNWWNRNKRAAEEAAKATKEYNEQFKFSQNGYGTRTVSTYTTGILFWETTHYTEQVDEMKKAIALGVEGGFVNGFKDGFSQALAKNDFSLFEKSLKSSVGKAVLDGLTESFINRAVLAKIIGPAIDAYLKTGDAAALQTAIRAASGEAKKFYDDVLAPIAKEFGLLGTDVKPADTATTTTPSTSGDTLRTVRVEMPKVEASMSFDVMGTIATVVERAAPRIEGGGQAIERGAGVFGAQVDRLERILTATELKPNLRDARGL
ncbi:MAG: phage tail tape measure protein [Deinococcus sp.]|uniref:phage tail tape measure protein n=1 Tax=Deinococcus sp. TaxID=47478 RepID=UPI0026DC2E8D|nr:phage tail tape measure protein [Deinococcus sp.]MDO4246211.1 phage tail tape measure protein [Deinococcus sp.]